MQQNKANEQMHKRPYERIRDFFINMGKHHRVLLPLAVAGLAVTMFITNVCVFFLKGTKRFACAIFVLCFFMIGNSFAYPYFGISGGFAEKSEEDEEVAAFMESDISLDEQSLLPVGQDNVVLAESEELVSEEDIYSLEDILNEIDADELSESAEDMEQENGIEGRIFDASDWRLILINKQHPIPQDYTFELMTVTGSLQCDARIADDLLKMLKAAKDDGLKINIASPYRGSDRQEYLFNKKISNYMKSGYTYMEAYKLSSQAVTVPGASEHQVGLAIDFNTDTHIYLDEAFEDTEEGKWLKEHCAEYGFIIRYPKGKEYITSIEYEPWHFRYVGRDAATVIMKEELSLEEFWERYVNNV